MKRALFKLQPYCTAQRPRNTGATAAAEEAKAEQSATLQQAFHKSFPQGISVSEITQSLRSHMVQRDSISG